MRLDWIQFINLINSHKGTDFVGLTIETKPNLNVKSRVTGEPCPFSDVVKHSRWQVMVGADYEKRVRKVTDNPNFVAGPHVWSSGHFGQFQIAGETISPSNLRMQCMIQSSEHSYLGIENRTNLQRFIEDEELIDYLPKKSDNPSRIVTLKLESIKYARINRAEWKVVPFVGSCDVINGMLVESATIQA
jgi:hypothetical protein